MNLELPQYLENSQSYPLQKEKAVFCNADMNLALSAQALQHRFSSLKYAHYFRKPVTGTGKKTHLSFHDLQLLSFVSHSVPYQNGCHSTLFQEQLCLQTENESPVQSKGLAFIF